MTGDLDPMDSVLLRSIQEVEQLLVGLSDGLCQLLEMRLMNVHCVHRRIINEAWTGAWKNYQVDPGAANPASSIHTIMQHSTHYHETPAPPLNTPIAFPNLLSLLEWPTAPATPQPREETKYSQTRISRSSIPTTDGTPLQTHPPNRMLTMAGPTPSTGHVSIHIHITGTSTTYPSGQSVSSPLAPSVCKNGNRTYRVLGLLGMRWKVSPVRTAGGVPGDMQLCDM